MAEHVRVMLTEEEVDARINEIGKRISEDYAGKQVHLICVLKGGSFFMCELAKRINLRITPQLTFVYDSSAEYGANISKILKGLDIKLMEEDDD